MRLILVSLLLGTLHLGILASAGLWSGHSLPVVFTSLLVHLLWTGALVALVAGGLRLLRRGQALAPVALAAYLLAYVPFLAMDVRAHHASAGTWTLLILTGLVCIGALVAVVRAPVADQRKRIAPGMALAAAVLAGLLARSAPEDRIDPGDAPREDYLEALRPQARRVFADRAWNVLLLTVDTLRADHLGVYGYDRDTSPVLDALAARGMVFENVAPTRPKTSPSFASLHTGTYPSRHGIHTPRAALPDALTTLAEALAQTGRATGASVTNGNLFPIFHFDQGFEHYAFGSVDAAAVTDRALQWLAEREGDGRPWLLWAHYTDPHMPYDPPSPHRELFLPGPQAEDHARQVALYDGAIHYTDAEIGRLLAWLDARPEQMQRTLIVFTADHGESLGEHDYYYEHGLYPYEATSRVPLIVVAPGRVEAGTRRRAVISLVDLMPTILDAVGAPVGSQIQGHSFLPLLAGLSARGPRDVAYIEAGYGETAGPGRMRALRRSDTKYIERLTRWALFPRTPRSWWMTLDARTEGGLDADEFYDLSMDPLEAHDLGPNADSRAMRDRRALRAVGSLRGTRDFRRGMVAPEELDEASRKSLEALGYIN